MQTVRVTRIVSVDDLKEGVSYSLDLSNREYLKANLQKIPVDILSLVVSLAHEIAHLYPEREGTK